MLRSITCSPFSHLSALSLSSSLYCPSLPSLFPSWSSDPLTFLSSLLSIWRKILLKMQTSLYFLPGWNISVASHGSPDKVKLLQGSGPIYLSCHTLHLNHLWPSFASFFGMLCWTTKLCTHSRLFVKLPVSSFLHKHTLSLSFNISFIKFAVQVRLPQISLILPIR